VQKQVFHSTYKGCNDFIGISNDHISLQNTWQRRKIIRIDSAALVITCLIQHGRLTKRQLQLELTVEQNHTHPQNRRQCSPTIWVKYDDDLLDSIEETMVLLTSISCRLRVPFA
jgi:hypothetical protein